jgi:hypothetical protein
MESRWTSSEPASPQWTRAAFSAAGRKLRRAQSVVSQTLANWEAQLGVKLIESERTTGIYRRMVVTSSGRFAMLDGDLGFSLVPWVPVIEKRLGQ